ncbi:hypothetical protein GCM10027592_50210 [Spirosoma flavus]
MNTDTVDPKNRFLRLPFQFDNQLLEADLAVCQTRDWMQHYNKADFSGTWSSIALRSLSGSETDARALPGSYADTSLLMSCSYFQRILDQLDCSKDSVRLLSLAPGSVIHPHRDGDTSYERGFFRLHVPIQTGEKVAFVVDDHQVPMQVGECWYANFDLLHSVRNDGSIDRIHLVIDCHRNAWSDTLFEKAGYSFAADKKSDQLSPEVRAQIMAELARHNTDVARQLIEQLAGQS